MAQFSKDEEQIAVSVNDYTEAFREHALQNGFARRLRAQFDAETTSCQLCGKQINNVEGPGLLDVDEIGSENNPLYK